MARYVAVFHDTAGTTTTMGGIRAAASGMRRIKLYDIIIGSEADAADNEFLWRFGRTTTTGTSTAVTPKPLDPADAAFGGAAGENYSAEPTYTADEEVLELPLNQRATFRWVAPPGGEIVIPATASNGVGILTPTATAVVITATVYAEEQ